MLAGVIGCLHVYVITGPLIFLCAICVSTLLPQLILVTFEFMKYLSVYFGSLYTNDIFDVCLLEDVSILPHEYCKVDLLSPRSAIFKYVIG